MEFRNVIEQMIADDQIAKLIKQCKGKTKANMKEWYELVKDNPDLEKIPDMALIFSCRCYPILQTAIVYLLANMEKMKNDTLNTKN